MSFHLQMMATSEGPMRHNLKIGRYFNKFLKNVSILPIRENNVNNFYYYYQLLLNNYSTLFHLLV